MKSSHTQRLVAACAVALLAGGVAAQRAHDTTATIPNLAETENRMVVMDWLQNNAAVFTGTADLGSTGRRVSAAGDLNGDGLADMLVASFETQQDAAPGTVHIVFGVDHGLPASTSLSANDPTSTGTVSSRGNGSISSFPMAQPAQTTVTLIGDGLGSRTGAGLAAAGDVNADGIDDLLIGAPRALGSAGADAGKVFLVFGRTEWPEVMALGDMTANDGIVFEGPMANDRLGASVAGVGDVNGDGYDDMLFGAAWSSAFDGTSGTGLFGTTVSAKPTHGGAAYLVYGMARFNEGLDLGRMSSDQGAAMAGGNPGDQAGAAVASAGDVNGDGFDDMLIGAPKADPHGTDSAGEAYLLLGDNDLPALIDLGHLGSLGLTVQGGQAGERLGSAVAGGSDMDGDHLPDFAVGAPGYDDSPFAGSDEGRVILVQGAGNIVGVMDLGADVGDVTAGGGNDFSGNGNRTLGGAVGYGMPFAPTFSHFTGAGPGDMAGSSLAMGGNLQRDRFDDLVIGGDGQGIWLVNGGKDMPDRLDLNAMTWRGIEFVSGHDADTNIAIAFLGDMDGDGFDDLAFGDANASPNGLDGAGQVHVVKGCANLAVAAGTITSGETFHIHIHGTPGVGFILLVAASARQVPISTWRGDYWLDGKYFETVLRTFDEDGEVVIPVAVPAVGFAGETLYWQSATVPQGNGNDLSGLLRTTVAN